MKKKLLLILTISSFPVTLCSCTVNWFTTTVEVPWYYIAIPVCLIFAIAYIILMNTTFVCPHCNTEFKPKWYELSVCMHINGKRLVKCPKCNQKGFFSKRK